MSTGATSSPGSVVKKRPKGHRAKAANELLGRAHELFRLQEIDEALEVYGEVETRFAGTDAAQMARRMRKAIDCVSMRKRKTELTGNRPEPPRLAGGLGRKQEEDEATSTPQSLLARAHALFDAGDIDAAYESYSRLFWRFPASPEAAIALRLVDAFEYAPMARRHRRKGKSRAIDEEQLPPGMHRKIIPHGYSAVTGELKKANTAEILDFLATSTAYGASIGLFLGAATPGGRNRGNFVTAFGIGGAVVYPLLGGLFLLASDYDRGDLSIMLTVAGYAPLTAGLIGAMSEAPSELVFGAIATTGLIALVPAFLLGAYTDLDPGDVQLIRDAGFWGGAIVAGIALIPVLADPYGRHHPAEVVAPILGGLFAGLGLGFTAAMFSEIGYWRVRLITLVGWGSAAAGAALGGALSGSTRNAAPIPVSMAFTATAGMLIAYVATEGFDELAGDDPDEEEPSFTFLTPTLLPPTAPGRSPALGLDLVRGTF